MRKHQNGSENSWAGEETPGYFTDEAARRLQTAAGERPVYVELLRDLLPAGATVLDVGAGVGRDVQLLSRHGFDVIGVEPDAELLDALYALKQRVADGGLLVLTVSTAASAGTGSLPDDIRSPQRYQFFLSRLGLDLLRELDVPAGSGPDGTDAPGKRFFERRRTGS